MSSRTLVSLGVLAVFAGGLTACQKTQEAPAPAVAAAPPAAPVQATAPRAIPEDTSEAALMEQDRLARLARAAADPVAGVIERAELCLHFAGEEAYDDARRIQMNKAFADNRCDAVVADGDALKATRPGDAARLDAALADLRS